MGKSSIRPGFRFKPTDDELVRCYLKNKLLEIKLDPEFIAVVNINDFSPWDLPGRNERTLLFLAFNLGNVCDILSDKSILSGDQEWYFFWPILKKYNSGPRRNRTTKSGFWKRTGDGKKVIYKNRTVATRNTLIFHEGHRPKGERTDWVMHEFQMTDEDLANQGVSQDAYVICRVFKKSGFGPKNGEQYGTPYEEKDWDDDDDDDERSTVTSSMMIGVLVNTKNLSSSSMMNMTTTEQGPSTITYGENERLTNVPVNGDVLLSHGDRALLLQNNNTQEVEDPKGKKMMIVPVNENNVLVNECVMLTHGDLDSILCNNDTQVVEDLKGKKVITDSFTENYVTFEEFFDDLGPDAFNMPNVGGSSDYGLDAFLPDEDFWNFQEDLIQP